MYGRTPSGGRLADVALRSTEPGALRLQSDAHTSPVDRLRHSVTVEGPLGALVIDTLLHLPSAASAEYPVPVVVGLNFDGNDETIDGDQADRWPYDIAAEAGFAVLTADYRQIEPDDPHSEVPGVRALFPPIGSVEAPWGALGAWAWGLSRLLDAAETIEGIDASRAVVLGHSRLGKAALWAGAQDARFAVVASNDSGCGGASLFRHAGGEDLATITTVFPHWFTPSFASFAGAEQRLPVDQHELLACIAPRHVYVASAIEDHWADPTGEYLATLAATPAFELHGMSGPLVADPLPELGVSTGEGIGYHVRAGGHDLTAEDWGHVLAFARHAFSMPALEQA